MKKLVILSLLILTSIVLTVSPLIAAEQNDNPSTMQVMDRVEELLYGEARNGGLIMRLSDAEVALFGRELPGSIADRQNALLNFIQNGEPSQPSMMFKLGVAEWALEQETSPYDPVESRISRLERALEGSTMDKKPLAMRLERLLGLLLSENVTMFEVEVPSDVVLKAMFKETLSPADVKEGQEVKMALAQDLTQGTNLIAPKGSIIKAHIVEVKKPRSFGRPSEINIGFDTLLPLGPERISLVMGEEAKEAANAEKAQIAAVGTSFVGAILLGPVGLAGGFLVRGDAKDIPEGTTLFVQTSDSARVYAYPVPAGLQGMIEEEPLSEDIYLEMEDGESP